MPQANVVPGRYRQVAVATVPSLTATDLVAYFTGREVYFRTRFIVARCGERLALVEVDRAEPTGDAALFVPTTAARVLAGPEECALVVDEALDTAVPSQLALAAERAPGARCVVVSGYAPPRIAPSAGTRRTKCSSQTPSWSPASARTFVTLPSAASSSAWRAPRSCA